MSFNCQKYSIQGLVEEVDRHSRQLQKAADLTD
jgi:large subunit ribosomal protein L53